MKKIDKNFMVGRSGKFIAVSWPFWLALLVFLSIQFAIRNPEMVEHYYSMGIYPFIAKFLSFFSSLVPFSLWDIFWVLIILLIIIGLTLVLLKKVRFGLYFLHAMQVLAFLYAVFYLFWGYNYFRPKIERRIGWETSKPEELHFRSVLDSVIIHVNKSYTSVSTSEYAEIDSLVEASYRKNGQQLGIRYPNGKRRPKTMLFSSFFGKMGVNGYFGPFFNEIHLDFYLLPVDYPFVLAHEKAHQFGITSESEANLVAFVICVKSQDLRLKYSGYQSVLLYFLKDAYHMKDYKEYLSKIDEKVLGDLRYRQKYYQALERKKLSDMQSAVNDAYLKANKIDKGVKNYDQVVSLVISWYFNSNRSK
jgi:Protein of unknown function (DUF3810)